MDRRSAQPAWLESPALHAFAAIGDNPAVNHQRRVKRRKKNVARLIVCGRNRFADADSKKRTGPQRDCAAPRGRRAIGSGRRRPAQFSSGTRRSRDGSCRGRGLRLHWEAAARGRRRFGAVSADAANGQTAEGERARAARSARSPPGPDGVQEVAWVTVSRGRAQRVDGRSRPGWHWLARRSLGQPARGGWRRRDNSHLGLLTRAASPQAASHPLRRFTAKYTIPEASTVPVENADTSFQSILGPRPCAQARSWRLQH